MSRSPTELTEYLAEIARHPICRQAEVERLVAVIRDGTRPDAERTAARNRIVAGNLRLVVTVAHVYRGRGVPLADLVAEGNLGLMRAVDTYDPARARFSTYAGEWVKCVIRRSLAADSRPLRLPAASYWLAGRYIRTADALGLRLGRPATPDEIRAEMGSTADRQQSILDAVATGHTTPVGPFDRDDRIEPPDVAAARADDISRVRAALRRLPPREADILLRVAAGETHADVGRSMGLTRSRVGQIVARAMEMARAVVLGAYGGSTAAASLAAHDRRRHRAKTACAPAETAVTC